MVKLLFNRLSDFISCPLTFSFSDTQIQCSGLFFRYIRYTSVPWPLYNAILFCSVLPLEINWIYSLPVFRFHLKCQLLSERASLANFWNHSFSYLAVTLFLLCFFFFFSFLIEHVSVALFSLSCLLPCYAPLKSGMLCIFIFVSGIRSVFGEILNKYLTE